MTSAFLADEPGVLPLKASMRPRGLPADDVNREGQNYYRITLQ